MSEPANGNPGPEPTPVASTPPGEGSAPPAPQPVPAETPEATPPVVEAVAAAEPAVEPAPVAEPAETTEEKAPSTQVATAEEGCGLTVGAHWRGYLIEAEAPGSTVGERLFFAEQTAELRKVELRAMRCDEAETAVRRRVWAELAMVTDKRIAACIEAHEEGGWRYEVTARVGEGDLREWMACHQASVGEVRNFLQQMAEALTALHAGGVTHLNLRPATIRVDESGDEPVYVLTDLRAAALWEQPGESAAPVDPLYAPPETMGVARHEAGPRLCAWDWWSLGRVAQQLWLGRHVLEVVLKADELPPDAAARAEKLLREQEPPGVRPGAVECMGVEDSEVTRVLRGLLTASANVRWGGDEMRRWAAGEAVAEYYTLPSNARLWSWKGRLYTSAAAADFFTKAENWEAGEETLFQPEKEGTLARFLKEVTEHQVDAERLDEVCELAESESWREVPAAVRRTIMAAAVWLSFAAGAGGRGTLRVLGHAVGTVEGLGALIAEAGTDKGVAFFQALTSPGLLAFVESRDATGAQTLKTVAENVGGALRLGREQKWLEGDDVAGQVALLKLAFGSAGVLRERLEKLRAGYATHPNPEIARMMEVKTPSAAERIALAHLAGEPDKNGFITHEEWRRRRVAALAAEGDGIVTRLLWARLHRLLSASRLWGFPSVGFAAVVLAITAFVGWGSRHLGLTALVPIVLLSSRAWLWWRVRGMARRHDGAAAPWSWRDGQARCGLEMARTAGGGAETTGVLSGRLRQVQAEIAKLGGTGPERAAPAEPAWWDLWLNVAVVAFAMVALMESAVVIRLCEIPAIHWTRATLPKPRLPESVEKVIEYVDVNGKKVANPEALLATGRYEVVQDGFGRRLRGPLEIWDRWAPAEVPEAEVASVVAATPEQAVRGRVLGELALKPYGSRPVRAIVAVRVPTPDGFGVMLFNGRDRVLLDREVRMLRAAPKDGAWYRLGQINFVYLETQPLAQ